MNAPKLKNLKIREDGTIWIGEVRLSYPHLFEKWGKNEGDKKKYSAKFLLDKTTHKDEIAALAAHLVKIEAETFKGRLPNDKRFLTDGAAQNKDGMDRYYVVSASEDTAPDVINRDKSRINEKDDIVYAGCVVNVLLRPWTQNNSYGKRVNANLLAVQFVRDGEKFSGIERPNIDDAFDAVEEDFDGVDEGGDADPFG